MKTVELSNLEKINLLNIVEIYGNKTKFLDIYKLDKSVKFRVFKKIEAGDKIRVSETNYKHISNAINYVLENKQKIISDLQAEEKKKLKETQSKVSELIAIFETEKETSKFCKVKLQTLENIINGDYFHEVVRSKINLAYKLAQDKNHVEKYKNGELVDTRLKKYRDKKKIDILNLDDFLIQEARANRDKNLKNFKELELNKTYDIRELSENNKIMKTIKGKVVEEYKRFYLLQTENKQKETVLKSNLFLKNWKVIALSN